MLRYCRRRQLEEMEEREWYKVAVFKKREKRGQRDAQDEGEKDLPGDTVQNTKVQDEDEDDAICRENVMKSGTCLTIFRCAMSFLFRISKVYTENVTTCVPY